MDAETEACEAAAGAPKLYGGLASWWPLMSSPEEYAEEAAFYEKALADAGSRPPRTLLELGSGGGNNASYLRRASRWCSSTCRPGCWR